MGTLLSPLDALPLLEEIQCLPIEKISQALSSLLPRIQYPHPKLTECMLDLVQIHPHQTVSHLPDILPNDASVIHDTVETLSELLAADRTLLVPILATLASLPLSTSHRHQIRFTQQYALSVVDEKDLPAVVRSLVRTSGRRGLWSARALREGLSRKLSDDILPVLSAALCDLCNPKHPVTKYILAHPRLDWLDMHIFASLLSRPSARQMQFPLARRAVAAAMQNHYPDPKTALALRGMPTAARRLISIMVSACAPFPSDIAALAAFTFEVIRVCPETTNSIVADLGRGDATAQMVLKALVVHGVSVKPVSLAPQISVAVATKSGEWQSLFVMLRKSFLFGDEREREKALETAKCIVQTASVDVVRNLISLMNESVPLSLADPVAVGFLHITTSAIMRGLGIVSNVLDKRILSQCPKDFLNFESNQNSGGSNTIHIDIGLVWDQSLSAISSIVAAGAALKLAMYQPCTVESISANILNAVVLVPVVCVTLYRAVDYESTGSEVFQHQLEDDEDVQETFMSMNERDLASAIASFGASMAALIGIINVSSSCTGIFKRALKERKSTSGMKLLSNFLERLLEFDRMHYAMQFAYELLRKQCVQKETLPPSGLKKAKRKHGVQKGLDLAESVRTAVMRSLKDPRYISKSRNESIPDFPLMSVECIICSLISVPDDIGVRGVDDICTSRRSKDIELVRIDKLMARQLCWFLRGETREIASKPGISMVSKNSGYDLSELFATLDHASESKDAERRRFHDIFSDLEKDLVEKDDIFMNDCPSELVDEYFSEDPHGNVEWYASCKHACVENQSSFIQSSFDYILGARMSESSCENTATMIHSPIFAALLLDRATSYAMLARELRKTSTTQNALFLDTVILSGMFLCCLNQLLRFVAECENNALSGTRHDGGNIFEAKRRMLDFFQTVGENLLHDLEDMPMSEFEKLSKDSSLSFEVRKTLNALGWLGQFSVDSLVAFKATEAILIASEFGVVTKCFARKVCFKCLTTVYECDGRALWNEADVDWIRNDSLTSWSLKRRRSVDMDSLIGVQMDADMEPWIQLPVKQARGSSLVENLRILQYFTGMHVSSAVDEGCGWVREISLAFRGEVAPHSQVSAIDHTQARKCPRAPHAHKKYAECDVLLDMIGLRTILEILMQVATVALRISEISESLSSDDLSSACGSPIPTVSSALRLFAGLLSLHQRNRAAVLEAKSNNPDTKSFTIDVEADYIVISSSIAVLQMSRSRIEELLFWYSNPCVDVSQLPLESVELIQGIVGLTTKIVKQASDFAETMKKERLIPVEDEQRLTPSKRPRKSPGYMKRKQRNMHLERNESLTRSLRLIPKLVSSSENALLGVKKLAKTVGLRSNRSLMSFAPIPVEDDPSLHFGVGLKHDDGPSDDISFHDDPELIESLGDTEEEHALLQSTRENLNDSISAPFALPQDREQPEGKLRDISKEPETIKINIRRGTDRLRTISP